MKRGRADIRKPRVRMIPEGIAPVDFGKEEAYFTPIDPSVIQAQQGKYDNAFIGAFGNVPSSAPADSGMPDRVIPASHQEEGKSKTDDDVVPYNDKDYMTNLLDQLGVDDATRNLLQSEEQMSGGVDTYAPPDDYDATDEEVSAIFNKLGVQDDYDKYFRTGRGNNGYSYY
jgi:hypothetical protein